VVVATSPECQRKRYRITGQVQGVGFRPFVYRLAVEMGLTGWVLNDAQGVTIEVQGREDRLETFSRRLVSDLPPLAQIARCEESRPAEPMIGEKSFDIRPSEGGELTDAQVTVDTAVCADCLREMNDPADRRHRYPFINCTNCGPRYTIVTRVPYDRPNTTMADFAMCRQCAEEYSDPASRRFHAQPIACPECGPAVWLVDPQGRQITTDDPVAAAAGMLLDGRIVAIKGLGGFHLACRADDGHVVRRLRERKRRDAKPFAVMVRDLDQAHRLCEIPPEAERLLTGPLRPIVLLPARKEVAGETPAPQHSIVLLPARKEDPATAPGAGVSPAVAEGLDTLGIMLPYTPLHHLLFRHDLPPLVMTSGNYSEEPLVKDNDAAIAHLGRIADALLLHNRRIERRLDDSVVQMHGDGLWCVARRARGFAPTPTPIALRGLVGAGAAPEGPAILAVGAELKSAVCLFKDGRAVLGEHIGDLKDGRVYRHFIDTINHLEALYEFRPQLIVADAHPQYLSSEYAVRRHRGELPGRPALPIVHVQHHHAHVVSCLAEHGREGPVIGLACDGVGYGDDGATWGCEILRADLRSYERLGHLRYLLLPGGDASAVETYRPAVAALYDAFGADCLKMLSPRRLSVDRKRVEVAVEMLTVGLNCPPASSLGRWFDAVAALCGVAEENRYEGQAAMLLEAAARNGIEGRYEFSLLSEGPFLIDLRPMVDGIVSDMVGRAEPGAMAARFHNTVSSFLAEAARRAREQTGLNVVALSGGCFANRRLTVRLTAELAADGFEVLRHQRVPCNDGGVALGQAVVAAAREQARARSWAPSDHEGR